MAPDQILKSHRNGSPSSSSHSHANQSSWMSHWTRTSYQPRQLIRSHSSSFSEEEDAGNDNLKSSFQSRFKIPSDVYKSAKRAKAENEERTVDMTSDSLKSREKTFKNGMLVIQQPFCQDEETSLASRAKQGGIIVNMRGESTESSPPALPVQGNEGTLKRHCNLQPESNYHGKHKGLAVCPSYDDDNKINSSHAMPDKEFGKQLAKDNPSSLDQRHHNQLLVHAKKADSNNSIIPLFKQRDWALVQKEKVQYYAGRKKIPSLLTSPQSQHMQNRQERGFFPGRICPNDAAESEDLDHHGRHLLKRMPHSVGNMATMQICIDAVEDPPRVDGPSKFFQTTTHRVLITRSNTDVNATTKEHQMFGDPQKLKDFDGSSKSFCKPITNRRQGVKIQSLFSSSDSEEMEKDGDAVQSDTDRKNESSAETDTMDMNAEWDTISGPAFSQHNEDIMGNHDDNTTSFDSQREHLIANSPATKILDAKKEHMGEKATSISLSRTQTMDVDHLPSYPGPSPKLNPQDSPEPSSRWVKRLKLSSFNSLALGTESSKGEESYAVRRMRQPNSDPKQDQDPLPMEETISGGESQRYVAEPLSTGVAKSLQIHDRIQNQRNVLSQSWIRRWRPKQNTITQEMTDPTPAEPIVICDPQSLKFVAMDELRTKQFPSIAAMALMGKTMNGFRACEFSKRGPLVMWNTKEE